MLINSTEALRRLPDSLDLEYPELHDEKADVIAEHARTLQAVDCLLVYVVDPATSKLVAHAMPAHLDRLKAEVDATEDVVNAERAADNP